MIGLLWVVFAFDANFTKQFENFQTLAETYPNLEFFNQSDLFWVTMYPSKIQEAYKKILVVGGLHGSLIESETVYQVIENLASSEVSRDQNIVNFLQIDFFPIPNYKVYKFIEKDGKEQKIVSDLSLAEKCQSPTAGINPDMNFEGSWKRQGKDCEPNFSGNASMISYVTTEIKYGAYDAIFNIQNSDGNFICGAFTSNKKDKPDLGDLSIVYDKAYKRAPENYESGDCYDVNQKELFGTLVDYASYHNQTFILQLSDKDQKMNAYSFIANVISELFTGIDIIAQGIVDESIDDGKDYSQIKWEFYLYNYDKKDINVKVTTRLEFLYDIYNLTKIEVEIYDLELDDKKDEVVFYNENDLEINFEYGIPAYRTAKCIVYIEKSDEKDEIDFRANLLLVMANDENFFKAYEYTVAIELDDNKKEFLFSWVVILLMVVAFVLACCGVITCVMENKPCNCFITTFCACCVKQKSSKGESGK